MKKFKDIYESRTERIKRAKDMIKYYDAQKKDRTLNLKYDRNPRAVLNALKQMGKRLNLTVVKHTKGEFTLKGALRDLSMFMQYLNTKGVEPDVLLHKEEWINEATMVSDISGITIPNLKKEAKKKNIKVSKVSPGGPMGAEYEVTFTGAEKDLMKYAKEHLGFEGRNFRDLKKHLDMGEVKEDMSRYYDDKALGLSKPKTWNPKTKQFEDLDEDAPANAAGAGNVAGIGVGPDGEPGVKLKKKELDARTKKFKEWYLKLEKNRVLRAERKSRLAAQAVKQVESFNHEYTLVENNIKILRDIVKKKQNKPVRFKDGQMKVDLTTASAITQVYDKVNTMNRSKIDKMINSRKADFLKISNAVFGMLNKR